MNSPKETVHDHVPRKNRWVIPGLILLVAVPITYKGCQGEFDRWQAARVMESWLDGEKREAIDDLHEISKRLPDDHGLKLVLGEWLLTMGATNRNDQRADEALAMIEDLPEQYRDRRSETLKQHCLLALGRPDEALQAYQEANPAGTTRSLSMRVYHLNALAYFQALAEKELGIALGNSHFVVQQIAKEWNNYQHIPLSAHMQGMFCSSMVYWHQIQRDETDEARKAEYADKATTTLSGAIAWLESEYKRLCKKTLANSPANEKVANQTGVNEKQPIQDELELLESPSSVGDDIGIAGNAGEQEDKKPEKEETEQGTQVESESARGKEQLDSSGARNEDASDLVPENSLKGSAEDVDKTERDDVAHALATLLTLRALIYQDTGQDDLSFNDRRRVIKIGFKPETIAGMMPSFSDCVFQLELIAMVLDTRGCVLLKKNELPAAIGDLNIAVIAQQSLVDVAEFVPRTSRESSLDPRQQAEVFVKGPQRTLAALLFHRSWARYAVDDDAGARSDVAAIRELGFVPGNYLY